MIKVILTVGIQASGKSTWAIEEVKKNPNKTVRINRDSIRNMLSNYTFTEQNERLVTKVCDAAFKFAAKGGYDIILDNTNLKSKNFKDACKLIKDVGVDAIVMEKPFYVDLDVALERNAKREGTARIPDEIIKKYWKESGGVSHKHYHPKVETIQATCGGIERFVEPMKQDENLPKCAIFDLDGTMCNISHRNPYDASKCDKDTPNQYVVDLCRLLYDNGYKIFFFSGREDLYKDLTSIWLDVYFGKDYELAMRETGNKEDDRLLKERLFNTHVKDKFNCKLWVDDRLRVCKWIHEAGLPLFRVGQPDADF